MIPENAVIISRDNQRSQWIRLRTMFLLRWVAILGQSAAVLVAVQFYNLRLELDLIILPLEFRWQVTLWLCLFFQKMNGYRKDKIWP